MNLLIAHSLIMDGWIRVTQSTNGSIYMFDVNDTRDRHSLKLIEDKIFNLLSPSSDITIWVNEYHNPPIAKFEWQDFLNSGKTFYDFVQESKDHVTNPLLQKLVQNRSK
jgi:hypothetical protein